MPLAVRATATAMILKPADDKNTSIAELESYLAAPGVPKATKENIEIELKRLRAGLKGERESAYDINFYSGAHPNRIVIHDLRIEHNGRVAQIDHLVLNRLLEIYVLETKHFSEGVSINEQGEFSVWFKGKPRGISSPLEQNQRHIAVLTEVFKVLDMPSRLGIRLQPSFESLVLVSNNARINRPDKFDTSRVLKSDQLERRIAKNTDAASLLMMAKLVSMETLADIGQKLIALHRPLVPDYKARFGITEEMLLCAPTSDATSTIIQSAPVTTSTPGVAAESTAPEQSARTDEATPSAKLTTSKLAKASGLKTQALTERLITIGLLELRDGKTYLTAKGKEAGGEFRMSPKFGPYFLWPNDLPL